MADNHRKLNILAIHAEDQLRAAWREVVDRLDPPAFERLVRILTEPGTPQNLPNNDWRMISSLACLELRGMITTLKHRENE